MKKFFTLLFASIISYGANAQARLATADYNKTMQPAVEIEIPFEEKTVIKSVIDKIEKKGYKAKETKGYTVFKGVNMTEIGPDTYDLYFKADRKSRKEKEISILTMLVSSGFDKFIGDSTSSTVVENAKTFLNNHVQAVVAYDLELQIKEQEEVSGKSDKKYSNMVEDGQDLAKKKEKLEKEIIENTQKQAELKQEAEKQKQILDTLKAKRKQ